MTEYSSYPHGFGATPPPSGPPGPGYTPHPGQLGRNPRTGLLASGIALAVVLAIAALVLAIVALVRGPVEAPTSDAPQAQEQRVFVADADKPLCEAIAPLMREESDRTNSFLDKGSADSPERLAAIPDYKAATAEWAERIQNVLNEHADPPRYLTRTLQQYIDGMLLYSENLYKERGPDAFDKTTYDSAIVALGGPLGACYKVGVRW